MCKRAGGNSKEWNQLMALAQDGDADSYRLLLSEVASYLRPIIRSRVSDSSYHEDIIQDILMTIHRARHTFNPERSFKPWLYAITESRIIDHLRKGRGKNEISSDFIEEISESDDLPNSSLVLRDFRELVKTLPQKQQEIFLMLKLEGLSIKQVSKKLSMKESAVKVAAHRAYKKIFGFLKGDSHENR